MVGSSIPPAAFANRTVRRLDLARHTRIALLGALLNMRAVEDEVIPIDATPLKDGHLAFSSL